MFRAIAFAISLLAGAVGAQAQQSWVIDHSATEIVFRVGYLNEPKLKVEFDRFVDATYFDPARPEITQSVIHVVSASAHSGIGLVNNILQGPDYLDVGDNPFIKFFFRELRQTSPSTADVVGNLTLLGVTRPVELKAEVFAYDPNAADPADRIAGFNIRGSIDRTEFGNTVGVGQLDTILPVEIRLVFRPGG